MKNRVNVHQLGLVVGFFAAIIHLIWVFLVWGGVAQQFLNWALGLHMIANRFTVATFGWGTAIYLLIIVFVFGYIFGAILGWIYNRVCQGGRRR